MSTTDQLAAYSRRERVRLCETCVRRATEDSFVIFACALPIDAAIAPIAAP